MDRVILHCDCNSFFASVETALNPAYRGVPMAVCGSVEDRHGIVLAKNEEAKRYGIVTAETVYSAKKKCPALVIATPHYSAYSDFSRRVNSIYADYTDKIEPFGIDESWLDITASIRYFGSSEKIAEEIRRRVKDEIGITVSIGVSFNKVFAKLGSDYKKPDAITYITKDNYKEIVSPLPASDLLFVGKKTSEQLKAVGIRTIGELSAVSREFLVSRFGKMGHMLFAYSNGLDDSPVCPGGSSEAKSISNGFTFRHDLVNRSDCLIAIEYLSEEIGCKLRCNLQVCTGVSLTVKDEFLKSIVRQRKLDKSTDTGAEIAKVAYDILDECWQDGRPIRMLTVSVYGLILSDSMSEQIGFFEECDTLANNKGKKKEETIDKIRQKYGTSSIIRGAIMSTDIGIYEPNKK